MQFTADVSRYGDKITVRISGWLKDEAAVAERLATALCEEGESVTNDDNPAFSASHGYLFTVTR